MSGASASGGVPTSGSSQANNGASGAGTHSGYASPAASVTSADIAADFANLTLDEQERQRAEWSRVSNISK